MYSKKGLNETIKKLVQREILNENATKTIIPTDSGMEKVRIDIAGNQVRIMQMGEPIVAVKLTRKQATMLCQFLQTNLSKKEK